MWIGPRTPVKTPRGRTWRSANKTLRPPPHTSTQQADLLHKMKAPRLGPLLATRRTAQPPRPRLWSERDERSAGGQTRPVAPIAPEPVVRPDEDRPGSVWFDLVQPNPDFRHVSGDDRVRPIGRVAKRFYLNRTVSSGAPAPPCADRFRIRSCRGTQRSPPSAPDR